MRNFKDLIGVYENKASSPYKISPPAHGTSIAWIRATVRVSRDLEGSYLDMVKLEFQLLMLNWMDYSFKDMFNSNPLSQILWNF